MTSKNIPDIVHEAEAQRQHIRLPLPVKVEVAGKSITAADWSNGGIGLQFEEGEKIPSKFKQDATFDAIIQFPFEGFGMALPVSLEVTHTDTVKNRVGCRFHNLSRQQQSVIQYFVSAYISGEIIRVNDVMDVVARNNFTRARNIPDAYAGLTPAQIRKRKLGAALRGGILATIGLLLVGYVGISVYERLFVVRATTGRVTAETLTVDAPSGGKVFFNPIAPDTKVKQGEPLLTISTSSGNTLTVDSPCDCIVKRRLSENNRVARKADPLLELVHPDAATQVEAYVHHRDAVKLSVGDEAMLAMPGSHRYLRGKITAIQAGRGLEGNSLVFVTPNETVSAAQVDDPVEVRVDTLHGF